ncbi:MAG: hypothetical protein ACQEQD_08340, partial [Bacillota bacterium]
FPFYRKGKIKYDFYNESLSYYPEIYAQSVVDFNCYGDSNSNFKGLITAEKAKEIMIENAAHEFVKNLNNHNYLNKYITTKEPTRDNNEINKKLFFNFDLSWLNSNKEKSLTSEQSNYDEWIMDRANNIEIFTQNRSGKQTIINYKTNSSVDDIIDYYNNLLVNKNISSNKNSKQMWQVNYSDKKVLGFNGLNTEDFKIDIVIDYLPLKERSNSFSENKTDIKSLKSKNVQIVYWEYNEQAKVLERIRRGEFSLEEIQGLLDNEQIEKDIFYYLAELKLIQEEIKRNYWEDNIFSEKLENDYLNILNSLKSNKYENMDIFYQGLYYQNKANMLHSPELANKATSFYRELEYKGEYGYGKGATKRLKQIKVMPYLSSFNYQELINEIKDNDLRGEFLKEYELLLKGGEFEKALEEIQYPTFSQKPVKVILYALLDKDENGFELLEERDNIISWELSKAIAYQLRGEGLKSSQKLDEINSNFPKWQFKDEVNKLYLRTGLELIKNTNWY